MPAPGSEGLVVGVASDIEAIGIPLARFFFIEAHTPEIYTCAYTLSLHDALPIFPPPRRAVLPSGPARDCRARGSRGRGRRGGLRSEEHTSELQSQSHISYAV